jgi:hypothetical protein
MRNELAPEPFDEPIDFVLRKSVTRRWKKRGDLPKMPPPYSPSDLRQP